MTTNRRAVPLEFRREFGDRLRARRIYLGMSQDYLAELCGVHPKCVPDWEHGRYVPHMMAWVTLARALEVSVEWMLSGEDARSDT